MSHTLPQSKDMVESYPHDRSPLPSSTKAEDLTSTLARAFKYHQVHFSQSKPADPQSSTTNTTHHPLPLPPLPLPPPPPPPCRFRHKHSRNNNKNKRATHPRTCQAKINRGDARGSGLLQKHARLLELRLLPVFICQHAVAGAQEREAPASQPPGRRLRSARRCH